MPDVVIKLYGVDSAGCSHTVPNGTFNTSATVHYGEGEDLFIQFDAFPNEYKYRDIINITPYVYCTGLLYEYSGATGRIYFSALMEPFDADTVTNYTAPSRKSIDDTKVYRDDVPAYLTCYPEGYIGNIRNVLNYGLLADGGDNLVLGTTRYSKKPYIELRLSETDVSIHAKNLKSTENVKSAGVSTFKWDISPDGYSYADVEAISAVLQWKTLGSSTVHEITADTTTLCNVPAGTFPTGKISIRVAVTATSGTTSTSEWVDFTVYAPGITNESPKSGYVPKKAATVFSWEFSNATLPQTAAVFRWRAGADGEIHEISAVGATTSLTVPAGTFTADEIQWQIEASIEGGYTAESIWWTLSTVEVTSSAKVLSPQNTVVDGTADILFQWSHIIETNTAQTKADLQKSADGKTWETLAAVTGAETQWLCPAGTLTTAVKYWRVRTYNTGDAAGEWSDAAQIVVIAAPTAPSIQIKSTGPRPSISWQTSEQEAYQVELDGALSGGTHYGTEKTWTSPAYLADGSHTVRVRVQNQYGMWSDWGAAALPVTNTPGSAITLSVQASSVADLSWQTSGSYDFYLVYRNGKPIAKLTQTQYTDELSSGSTTYQVRGCYADSGNYGLSGAVTATITTGQYVTLYGIASGKKVTLKHCGLKNQPVQNAINRDIQYIFMYGSTYPHAERSEFVTKKVGGTAVFLPDEDKAGFDALIGELVCLKTQSGEMVIGYLNETSDTSRVNPDKSVVNFSIQQIDYAEVIDIDS